jgi:hypothetical protein
MTLNAPTTRVDQTMKSTKSLHPSRRPDLGKATSTYSLDSRQDHQLLHHRPLASDVGTQTTLQMPAK